MRAKYLFLAAAQIAVVILSGILSGDTVFVICNAAIGIIFNFLVSMNIPVGFLFGIAYAVTNGVIAFQTRAFATFTFMIFLQIPMAIYSYIKWKSKKSDERLKTMTRKQQLITALLTLLLGIVMYFVLKALKSNSVIFDDMFFVFSVCSCLLLAFCFKSAYIITLFSGIFGTVLWTVQYIKLGTGLAVAVFYFIMLLNSIIAVYQQYIKVKKEKKE